MLFSNQSFLLVRCPSASLARPSLPRCASVCLIGLLANDRRCCTLALLSETAKNASDLSSADSSTLQGSVCLKASVRVWLGTCMWAEVFFFFCVCNWFISWIISLCRHGHSSGESLEMTIKVLGMKNTTHTLLALQSSAFQMAKKTQTAHIRKVCTWAPCWVRLTLWWWVRGCLFGSLNCQDKIWQVEQGCSSNHCCLSSWCMFAM